MTVLWADDDSRRPLAPLGRLLRRRLQKRGEYHLENACSYDAAITFLEDATQAHGASVYSLLVDVILPHRDGGGALSTRLGLMLAKRAIPFGLRNVAFLTVMPLDEVADHYSTLQADYGDIRWEYFSKADLLVPDQIDRIVEHLTPADPPVGAR